MDRIAVYVAPPLDRRMQRGEVTSVTVVDCDIVHDGQHYTKRAVETSDPVGHADVPVITQTPE